jgi:hypothetical protein
MAENNSCIDTSSEFKAKCSVYFSYYKFKVLEKISRSEHILTPRPMV